MSYIQYLIYIILFIPLCTLIKHLINNFTERLSLPPGPIGLPLLGCLPFLGKEPHKNVNNLSHKYGNVFTLQIGVKNVVILNDWKAAKDLYKNDDLLGKPIDGAKICIGIKAFADRKDELWLDKRRFSQRILRDMSFGKGLMEDRVIDEITYLTQIIDKSNGQPINIHTLLVPSISNIIANLVFGYRLDFNDPKRISMDQMFEKDSTMLSHFGLISSSPVWLTKLMFKFGLIPYIHTFKLVQNMLDDEIDGHIKSLNVNNKRDYIDRYLNEMQNYPNIHFDMHTLRTHFRGLFRAGSAPVRITIEWLLILSAKYPEHQKRIHREIDSVIGRDRSAVYADRQYMPYTQAFMNEYWRWKTLQPFQSQRCALKDTYILGHFIPKNTVVLVNTWAVHNDPKVWDKPYEFNPNRFLTPDGKLIVKSESFIPFADGKRSCVGEPMGRIEVFLYLVSLLQRYVIKPENDNSLTLDDIFGVKLEPKSPPVLVFDKRI